MRNTIESKSIQTRMAPQAVKCLQATQAEGLEFGLLAPVKKIRSGSVPATLHCWGGAETGMP